jgi:TPR repeat protein
VIWFGSSSFAVGFDQRLTGSWRTVIPTNEGSLKVTWTIASDGKYEVHTTGPATDLREFGVLTADAGRWSKQSATGLDGGAYVFETNDRLMVRGAGGALTWNRSSLVPSQSEIIDHAAAIGTSQHAAGTPAHSPADSAQMAGAQAAFDEGSRVYKSGDEPGSFPHFMKAAKLGHAAAQLQVGWHYENGVGVEHDEVQAAAWYEKSAQAGNATAMKNIGQMYELGQGVREDWLAAAAWYRQSAERGDRTGEFALARAYRFGIGVPQNRSEAIRWYTIAAEHGEPEAADDAHWLSDPTNNVGFRNQEEHRLVMNNQLRFSGVLFGADPAGICFRNAQERINWLIGLRVAVDKDEEETRRELARRAQQREAAVKSLMEQGYSRSEAEAKAPY